MRNLCFHKSFCLYRSWSEVKLVYQVLGMYQTEGKRIKQIWFYNEKMCLLFFSIRVTCNFDCIFTLDNANRCPALTEVHSGMSNQPTDWETFTTETHSLLLPRTRIIAGLVTILQSKITKVFLPKFNN